MSASPPDDPWPTLLDRYLAGECSGAEVETVHTWLAAHPEHPARLGQLRQLRDVVAHRPTWDVSSMWNSVTERIVDAEPNSVFAARDAATMRTMDGTREGVARAPMPSSPATGARTGRRLVTPASSWTARQGHPWWVRAAVVTGVAAVAVVFWSFASRQPSRSAAVAARVYTTHNGERATVTLPDGSSVMLSDATTLTVPLTYGAANRTVTVRGAAYFTVTHLSGAPFTVHAANTATRVLGTAFAVRKYDTDAAVRIAVANGRVAVTSTPVRVAGSSGSWSHATVLSARMMGEVTDSGAMTIVPPGTRVDDALAWSTGRLVFHDVPLRDAIPELERRYDLTVQLADSALSRETLNATFGEEPVSDVLDGLALAFHAHYTRSGPGGRVITFTMARHGVQRVAPSRSSAPTLPEAPSYGR